MSEKFDREGDALLLALDWKIPERSWYAENIDFDHAFSGSANHKMQCNPTDALVAMKLGQSSRLVPFKSWAEFYASAPLHENESLTPNPAYRKAITDGTYALAGIAHELGEFSLRDAHLIRSRADVSYAVLGAVPGWPRDVVDHFMNEQSKAHLFVANSKKRVPIKGMNLDKHCLGAGKRVHVREGKKHDGPLNYTRNECLAELVACAIGSACPPGRSETFRAIRNRWPSLPPYGFFPDDVATAVAFMSNRTNVALAYAVFKMARAARANLPVTIIQFEDGGAAFFFRRLDPSSTGGRAFEIVHADGTRYLGSADTGRRDSDGGNDAADDIRKQVVSETGSSLVTRWADGAGVPIIGPLPNSREIWRAEFDKDSAEFYVGGVKYGGADPAPGPSAPVPPVIKPQPRRRRRFNFS